jgi:ketosteroid isomerase-like protein
LRNKKRRDMATEENKAALVDAFDAAWNAHDEDAIMDWFTEEEVVSISPSPPGHPDTYHGKEQIRGWVRSTLPGFHVESRSHGEVGDTVTTSDVTVVMDSLPIESADAMVATVFEGRKVRAMRAVFTPETLAKMRSAMENAEN